MEKIGEVLMQKRISKGLSIEDIAKKTNISKKHIESIEKNSFSDFPGEVYVRGFIRNIAKAIGLNDEEVEEVVRIYKNQVGARQTISSDPKPPILAPQINFRKNLIIVSASVLLLIIIIFIVKIALGDKVVQIQTIGSDRQDTPKTFEMEASKKSEEFNLLKAGDVLKILENGKEYILNFQGVGSGRIDINFEGSILSCQNQSSLKIDLDKDGIYDMSMNLINLVDNKANISVEIRDNKISKNNFTQIINTGNRISVGSEYVLEKNVNKKSIELYIGTKNMPSFLDYNIDASKKSSRNLAQGEFTIISAKDHMEITIGNYKSTDIVLNNYYLDLTKNSDAFAITKIIKWVKNPENETLYSLVIVDN